MQLAFPCDHGRGTCGAGWQCSVECWPVRSTDLIPRPRVSTFTCDGCLSRAKLEASWKLTSRLTTRYRASLAQQSRVQEAMETTIPPGRFIQVSSDGVRKTLTGKQALWLLSIVDDRACLKLWYCALYGVEIDTQHWSIERR